VKPIKTCLMIDRAFLGGGQKNVLALAEGLDRSLFEVTVCSRPDGPLREALQHRGIPHRPIPFRKRFSFRLISDVRALLREGGFDILHTHGGVAGFYGRRAARASRVPVVIHTFHGIHYLHTHALAPRAAFIALDRRLSRHSDAVICVSDSVRDQSLAYRLVPEDKLTVIRNGIDFDLVLPSESEEFRTQASRLGLDSARPLIGTVARLDPVKGLPVLLKAAPRIRSQHPAARFVIVGDGPEKAHLVALTQELRAREYVHFLGERADALSWMGRCDVFVLPSLQEALPYVILEAAALAKPVVASEVGGIRELVKNQETGLLVPPGDPAALADAVIRLTEDPDLAQSLGRKLRSSLSEEYSLSRMLQQTQDLYLRLCQQKRGRV
jgi:glycosyltransferase involved in cell wall biosynthesis